MLSSRLITLYRNQHGGVLITWALILPVVIGMMGMGVETGTWYLSKRNLQAAADAAAIAGAYESTSAARTASAQTAVSANGFGAGSNISITVNNPPLSGGYTSNNNAVEVILNQPQTRLLSSLFLQGNSMIKARAVAYKQPSVNGGGCVLSLGSNGTGINIQGNATLTMPGCVLLSDSSNSAAINISGSTNTTVQTLYTVGTYNQSGSSTLTTTSTPITNASSVADPYSSITTPSYSGCTQNGYSIHGTETLSPGVYCNGLTLNAHANVTLNPGTYIIDRGSLSINGQATLTGTGVTIILTSSTNSNYATVSINGGATVSLQAPTSGTYSGIAFYQDRNAPENSDNFNGGSTMDITGALYLPEADVTFNGGNTTTGSCTQVVSNSVTFSGNNKLKSNCSGSGLLPINYTSNGGTVKLVE